MTLTEKYASGDCGGSLQPISAALSLSQSAGRILTWLFALPGLLPGPGKRTSGSAAECSLSEVPIIARFGCVYSMLPILL